MFDRLARMLTGAVTRLSEARTEDTNERLLAKIMSIPSPALQRLFDDRHRADAQDYDRSIADLRALTDEALAGDLLGMTLHLFARAPAAEAYWLSNRGQGSHRLRSTVEDAAGRALETARREYGEVLPIPAQQLPAFIRDISYLAELGSDVSGGRVYGRWAEAVMASAAAHRRDPRVREALLSLFTALFGASAERGDRLIWQAETLRERCGLTPQEVPEFAAYHAEVTRLDSIRARILQDAGEPLGTAIAGVFDASFYPLALSDAAKLASLRPLLDGSPEERGAAFAKLIRLIDALPSYGIKNWTQLQRPDGRYKLTASHSAHLAGFGAILGSLAIRKMVITDADMVVARFVALLEPLWGTRHRKVLALLLQTARAHPHGQTCQALRKLSLDKPDTSHNAEWRVEIEDMLRDLPEAEAASSPARPSVPAVGFGRKTGPASTVASALPGLPPIVLPDFRLNHYFASKQIGEHFDNVLEARLYDAAHLSFLERAAALADAIDKLEPPDVAAQVIALQQRHGFALNPEHDQRRSASSTRASVDVARYLWQRAQLFGPFVNQCPEEARRLGKLAAEIASKSAPTAKWLTEARKTIAGVSREQRLALFEAVLLSGTPVNRWDTGLTDSYLRALLYLAVDHDPAVIGPKLADYALKKCYVTEPGSGIRAEKLGNACLWVLANLPEGAGVPFLARVLARCKYPKIRAKVDVKLNEAAAKAGISRGELDEVTVPTHDLDAEGCCRIAVGEGEAVLRVLGARSVEIEWLGAGGKTLKAPSTAMKADKLALKSVRDAAKEIEADLGTQLLRLQRLYLDDRSWVAAVWRERFLDHPLLRPMVRRLIWWLERDGQRTAVMADASATQLRTVDGSIAPTEGAKVALWHPIEDTPEGVEAWRDRLEAEGITQPFAQAWREVYAVTDAERATGTYSNRWAAHILRQHQVMSLARLNGWRVTHRMWVDAPNDEPWHLTIPAHGLVADYWISTAGGDEPEVTDSGAAVYVSTDRVQFHAILGDAADSARGPARGLPVPLADLPPVIFSEVMRHADLFTAVASIAADPNWLDRGGDAAHPSQWGRDADAYWQRTNTAELEQSGKRRRAMLERIVPRLKIADKLHLDERYLHVQGKRHLYRVHLGSGACFRGERHLCIVPKADGGPRVWLPFEGDRTLSLILSKAVLLAADDKITDPVILRQL